jgi:glutathione peroxidase
MSGGAFAFRFEALDGTPLDLGQFAGRPMLVVNTASKCGFTPQYKGLQTVWEQFGPRGLVVLGVPCNDFGGQEPGSEAEIGSFCQRNYGVGFPMTAKAHVRGPEAHPLFRWLAHEGGVLSKPRWNFYKYLIRRDGSLDSWFSSVAPPSSGRVRKALDHLVKAAAGA